MKLTQKQIDIVVKMIIRHRTYRLRMSPMAEVILIRALKRLK